MWYDIPGIRFLLMRLSSQEAKYLTWQAYYDVYPRVMLSELCLQLWVQLHFLFHVALILLLEGSQILALTLDVTLKLTYLAETILFVCEEPRPRSEDGIELLRSTIADMEIVYSRGGLNEKHAIDQILEDLSNGPLCAIDRTSPYTLDSDHANSLMGNVTAALFQSMGISPYERDGIGQLRNDQLLRLYMKMLEFVYVYYFVVAALTMCHFAVFTFLTRRHRSTLYTGIGVGVRMALACFSASLIAFTDHFALAYSFMMSPTILYAFSFILLPGMMSLLVSLVCLHRLIRHRTSSRPSIGSTWVLETRLAGLVSANDCQSALAALNWYFKK